MHFNEVDLQEARETAADYIKEKIDLIVDDYLEDNLKENSEDWERWLSETLESMFICIDETDSLAIIAYFDDHEESDQGLIGSGDFRDQLKNKGYYTYRNAVAAEFTELIEEINSDDDLYNLREVTDSLSTDLEEEIAEKITKLIKDEITKKIEELL